MSNQYGLAQIVTDSSLRLCYDMNDANCYPGSGNIIYNLADSASYPSMSPISLDATNMTYIDFVTTFPKYVKLLPGVGNNSTTGNFLYGSGDMATGLDFNFTTMGWMLRTDSRKGTVMAYRRSSFQLRFAISNTQMYFSQRDLAAPYDTTTVEVPSTNSLDVWDHYALVKQGVGPTATCLWTFYKNGAQVSTTQSYAMTEDIGSSAYYDVGADWSDDDYISNNMGGYIGPFHDYTRALSAAEVKQNFEVQRSRFKV